MGRMTPAPSEASGGASAAAVADRFRDQQPNRRKGISDFSGHEKAERDLRRAPEFCNDGDPAVMAVHALVALRRKYESVSPRMLRSALWHNMDTMVARGRWTIAERDRMLADELPNLMGRPRDEQVAA